MRATSPAKTYSNLELLNKPVTYSVTDVMRDNLPEGISVLIEDPQVLGENVGIIPSKIQVRWSTHKSCPDRPYRIASLVRRSAPTGRMRQTGRDDLDVIIELDAMKKVHTAAVSLSATGDHEPQRCCSVI